MKPNPAVWFEIYVQDLARAKKFYLPGHRHRGKHVRPALDEMNHPVACGDTPP
jgi:hypothetical protein